MVLSADFKTGETTLYEGKNVKIVSTHRDYVTIEDERGNQKTVSKNFLMTTPLFNFYSEEARQERKERIAYYQEKGEQAKKEKEGFLAQVRDFWKQMGMYDKSDDEYKILKDQYWAARMDKTAAGNREYSAYLHAAMIASDPIT